MIAYDVNKTYVKITTLIQGQDNDKPSDIRYTYKISTDHFSIAKDVRFEDGGEFFNRNIYIMSRTPDE